MGGSSKKVTVGYKYYLGIHFILSHGPTDAVTRIDVDGKTAWSGNSTGGRINLNSPNLFGGEGREGGVSGPIDIEMGRPDQGRNDYLRSHMGANIPAYRGVLGVVLRQVYVGLNPYLKRWEFWVRRINTRQNGIAQWYNERAAIGEDMNPAHIIRECLTDPDWGMGYPEAEMDETSFRAAADTLYNEGFGLSILWDRAAPLDEFISSILQHIDAALFVDRTTGKFVLKLIRNDYNTDNLLVLDESSVSRITEFKRPTLSELSNSVTVVFWDRATGKDNSITIQDIALVARQGATVGTTTQYPGITNSALAARVAARDLRALSSPLAAATIVAQRKAAVLNVGDVFILRWPRYGIAQTVMRVTNIDLGALDNNVVKITAVEDAFSLPNAIYAPPPQSGWQSPVNPPAPCPHHCVIEAPYWEVVQRRGDAEAQSLHSSAGFVVATGVRPSSDATNARLLTNPTGNGFEQAGTVDFCPTAVLTADVSPGATIWPIGSGIDLDTVRVGSYAICGTEVVRVDAISGTTLTVGRGCLDTVPAAKTSGTRIFFADDVFETDAVEYATGETARIKLLPVTGRGILEEGLAPTQTVTMAQRLSRPYPPGRLRINAQAYPAAIRGDQPVVVSWAHRDRTQQTATIIDTEAGNIGPEPGTTYTVELRTEGGSLIASATGVTGTSHTFDVTAVGRMRVRLWSVRDGLDSYQRHDWLLTRVGYGVTYGYSYGGV